MTAKKYIYPRISMPHKLLSVYRSMISRCYNKDHLTYKNYGGKGIKVCESWLQSSHSFYYWAMNNGYKEGLTLDRIDPTKDYSADNCRFVSMAENIQSRQTITKLNPEKVKQLRKDFSTMTTREVGKKWGISHHHIIDIKLRRSWKNIQDE